MINTSGTASKQETTCVQCDQPKNKHTCCAPVYSRNKIVEYVGYDEWLPNVRILAPEVPDEILLDYIRRGCIEFAKKSYVLSRNIFIELQDCVADYYPCLGEHEQISTVNSISVNGHCYESVGNTCDWNVGDNKFWFHPPASLEIHPAPSASTSCKPQKMIMNVKAIPRQDSSKVDKFIYDEFFEAVEHHAVGNCHMIPNVPATSGEAHTFRMDRFKKEVSRAKAQIAQNYSSDLRTHDQIRRGY